MTQTDLYFQIWLGEINSIHSTKGYSQSLLLEAYNNGLSSEEFFYKHIYLPF